MSRIKACIVNYNHDPEDWWLDYGFEPEDIWLYDRSDDGIQRTFAAKTFRTANIGNVDYDKLGYIVEQYFDLPDVFFWGKSNIFKYVEQDQLREAINKAEFKPLTKEHAGTTDRLGVMSYMQDGLYWERNDGIGWYTNQMPCKMTFAEWCFTNNINAGQYIPFAPGGNYILTRDRVQNYAQNYYQEMRDLLPYCQLPAEAHHAERSYYLLWK